MKKILIGLLALSAVAAAQTGQDFKVDIKAGLDLAPEYDSISIDVPGVGNMKVTEEDSEGTGFEVAVESTKNVYPNFDVGVGIAYQKHAEVKSADYDGYQVAEEDTPYDSVPIYVTGKYTLPSYEDINFYLKGNLGYSFNVNDEDLTAFPGTDDEAKVEIDADDGLYWGLGAGLEYNNWIAELMYQVNYAEVEGTVVGGGAYDGLKEKDDHNYSRVTLLLGYSFDMQY